MTMPPCKVTALFETMQYGVHRILTLKGLFYAYNDKAENKEGMGLPRVQYKEKRVCLV